mmetsp:Transcript_8475/g.24885  ORF Transcript_8475/g.24885 Transcript_8475/m.24885 type:complete len:230 (+) Transcript_8475:465-1154(+)
MDGIRLQRQHSGQATQTPSHPHAGVPHEAPKLRNDAAPVPRLRLETTVYQLCLCISRHLQPLPCTAACEHFARKDHRLRTHSARGRDEVHYQDNLVVLLVEVCSEAWVDARCPDASTAPVAENQVRQTERVRVRHHELQPLAPNRAPRPLSQHQEEAGNDRVRDRSRGRGEPQEQLPLLGRPRKAPERPGSAEQSVAVHMPTATQRRRYRMHKWSICAFQCRNCPCCVR